MQLESNSIWPKSGIPSCRRDQFRTLCPSSMPFLAASRSIRPTPDRNYHSQQSSNYKKTEQQGFANDPLKAMVVIYVCPQERMQFCRLHSLLSACFDACPAI